MDEDNLEFDFEPQLEERQRIAAQESASISGTKIPIDAAIPVNQSAGSFKRNFRQTVCIYWLKGQCALGDRCGYLHEYNEERMPVCRNVLRYGVCKEPDCPYKHTLEDIKECNMFKLGFCVYGPQCRYRHSRLPGPPPEPKDIVCTRLRDLKRQAQELAFAKQDRNRNRSAGGRGPPRPPPGPPPDDAGRKRTLHEMSHPAGNYGFGHGMMGMSHMMPGMMNPMQMGMGMGFPPFWNGTGMFPYGYR